MVEKEVEKNVTDVLSLNRPVPGSRTLQRPLAQSLNEETPARSVPKKGRGSAVQGRIICGVDGIHSSVSSAVCAGPGGCRLRRPDQQPRCALRRRSGGQEPGGRWNNVERRALWAGCHLRSSGEKVPGEKRTGNPGKRLRGGGAAMNRLHVPRQAAWACTLRSQGASQPSQR